MEISRENANSDKMQSSCSSGETVKSKPAKDVLELGTHLVRELGIDDRDTLGRWLSHHIAELLERVESAPTSEERARAEAAATEAILKVWSNRLALPGRANPFGKYKRVLETLLLLKPEATELYLWQLSLERPLVVRLFQRILRLVSGVLALQLPINAGEAAENEKAITEFLEEDEKNVLVQITVLLSGEDVQVQPKTPLEARAELRQRLEGLISETIADLEQLRKEVAEARPLDI